MHVASDLSRVVLAVEDLKKSVHFYGRLLGLKELEEDSERHTRWFLWGNGIVLGLSPVRRNETKNTRNLKLYFRVEDLEATEQRLREGAVRVDDRSKIGSRLIVHDPDGNAIFIVEGRGLVWEMTTHTQVLDGKLLVCEQTVVAGEPEQIWQALVDPTLLSAWFCGGPAQINPTPGGELVLTFPHIGRSHTTWLCRIQEIIPPARMRFREETLGLEITLDVAPTGAGRSLVRLTQSPVDLPDGEGAKSIATSFTLTWRRIIRSLALLLEDELGSIAESGEPGEETRA